MASQRNGTTYIGVTSDLVGRISEHHQNFIPGFTSRYGVHRLVYYEEFGTMPDAIGREKQLKKWRRARKIELIQVDNPYWRDLWPEISGETESSETE